MILLILFVLMIAFGPGLCELVDNMENGNGR